MSCCAPARSNGPSRLRSSRGSKPRCCSAPPRRSATTRIRLISAHALGLAFVAVKLLNDLVMIRKGLLPSASLQLACWFTLGAVHAAFVFGGAIFTGWLAGPAFHLRQGYGGPLGIKSDDRERWLARIEATRRYWIFLDLVWLVIVGGFYVV